MLTTPLVLPVTIPVSFTLATMGFPLDHTPPDVTSPIWVVDPAHKEDAPVIGSTDNAADTMKGNAAVLLQIPSLTR